MHHGVTSHTSQNRYSPSAASPAADRRIDCFDTDPTACFIVSPDSVLRMANSAGAAMLADGLLHLDPADRICLGHARARRVVLNQDARDAGAVQVHALGPARWLVLSFRPLADERSDVLVRARDIMFDGGLDLTLVADRFGLTDSERPVLEGIAEAICPKDISRRLNLSIHTIRSHLRSIYAKMGAHSAAEAQTIALRLYYVVTLSDDTL